MSDESWCEAGVQRVLDAVREADADTAHLRRGLAERARREGLVDVAVRRLDSPVGRLLLAGTDDGLAYVGFEVEGEDAMLQMLAERIGPRIVDAAAQLDTAAGQIEQYLDGRRSDFDLPLDTRLVRGFRGEVQHALVQIDYGRTATYAQLAERVERPQAVRAVGTACATNPLPLVWPCHRVVRTGGGLGGYRGGLEAKRYLLDLEARRAETVGARS